MAERRATEQQVGMLRGELGHGCLDAAKVAAGGIVPRECADKIEGQQHSRNNVRRLPKGLTILPKREA
jgi:hypothetical protein